ncbi:hypothetical protein [Sinimarinibacterium flocculans]|uniref:hypothetical protein n=1 Tax=Sinimarinibacterium flocculans TaxID=985250 RepID=UPI003511EB01
MRRGYAACLFVLTIILLGCGGGDNGPPGGGGGGGPGYCVGSFIGGRAETGSTGLCNNCSVQMNAATVDDDETSFASLNFGIGGGQLIIRAVAPSGVTFPAEVDSGALMRFPSGSYPSVSVRFNTYREGASVDTLEGGASATFGGITGGGGDHYYQLSASGEFDTLEAVVELVGNQENISVLLYEFCGDR